jgi:hypothetical protein
MGFVSWVSIVTGSPNPGSHWQPHFSVIGSYTQSSIIGPGVVDSGVQGTTEVVDGVMRLIGSNSGSY